MFQEAVGNAAQLPTAAPEADICGVLQAAVNETLLTAAAPATRPSAGRTMHFRKPHDKGGLLRPASADIILSAEQVNIVGQLVSRAFANVIVRHIVTHALKKAVVAHSRCALEP